MDAHRNFADESEPRWYQGERGGYAERYGDAGYGDAGYGDAGYGDGDRYRVPEPRGTGARGPQASDPLTGPLPTSSPPAPPGTFFPPRDRMEHTGEVTVDDTGQRLHAERVDVSALRRPPGAGAPSVYLSKRPGLAVLLILATGLLEIPAFRAFASSAFSSQINIGGTFAGMFMVLALPMFAMGLYGLLSGAAAAPGVGVRGWLRSPLVYLPIALVLFVAAGLAA